MDDVRVGDIVRYKWRDVVWDKWYIVSKVEGPYFWIIVDSLGENRYPLALLPHFECLSRKSNKKSGFASFINKVENVPN